MLLTSSALAEYRGDSLHRCSQTTGRHNGTTYGRKAEVSLTLGIRTTLFTRIISVDCSTNDFPDSRYAYGVSCRVRAKSYPRDSIEPHSPQVNGSPAPSISREIRRLALQPHQYPTTEPVFWFPQSCLIIGSHEADANRYNWHQWRFSLIRTPKSWFAA